MAAAKMLSAEAVAEMLNITMDKMYRMLNEGQIPGYKIGRSWRISEDDLDEYLEQVYNQSPNRRQNVG